MRIFYDFHIHSALSPCADEEMTPRNIVYMAKLIGLDAIAVTDHNSTKNARAVIEASKALNGPLVIAGMEMETCENIHVVTLFGDIDDAEEFDKEIEKSRFKILNKKTIYGPQLIMDKDDNVTGEEQNLLVVSTAFGLYGVQELAAKHKGVAIPAHIDRPANGVIPILGGIDADMGFNTVEFTRPRNESTIKEFLSKGYRILLDSDAHRLESLNEREDNFLDVNSLDARAIIDIIKSGLEH